MHRPAARSAVALAAALLASCPERPPPTCAGEDTCPDGWSCDGCTFECFRTPPPDSVRVPVEFVVNTVGLPAGGGATLGCDLDGDGSVDNALGNLVQTLGSLGLDVEGAIAATLAAGDPVLLLRLEDVDSWKYDPQITVVAALGRDADADPANNYGGDGVFVIREEKVPHAMPGAFCGAALLAGPGELVLPVPLGSGLPIAFVTLSAVRLVAPSASAAGLPPSLLCGVVTAQEIEATLYPTFAEGLTLMFRDQAYDPVTTCVADGPGGASQDCAPFSGDVLCSADNLIDAGVCVPASSALVSIFRSTDLDGDAVIDVEESRPLLDLVLAPDLDTDGDGLADALSFAMEITAVPAAVAGF